ncbi:helix-turn-helix transcriptional regulator [Streptosporangium carneum]|uniref:HTH araC/xylS-type domain-containing protein n=1 Tax=Streptosporangium carneum TaxID=47481 RepID=A0A9W6I7P3_9ACTN|nr:helix-turn-helix transcriptional regulator [Streptosporangium carneum]GLK12500.1 hypothetical protein GCM10017600_59100 [Streptosporangium carneum]
MDEGYSSAAMVTLVTMSLGRRGLRLPAAAAYDGPRVSLAAKRRLLAAVANAHGEGELLLAGQAAADAPFDAFGRVLAAAPTAHECLARWGRLERYVHSRHRTVITVAGPRDACVHHTAPAGPAPTRHESLLVAGVLAGLLASQGCKAVRLSLPGGAVLLEHGRLTGPVPPDPVDRFHLAWTPGAPPDPEPGIPRLTGHGQGPVTGTVLARVAADPARRWTVRDLAVATGMSARTLQRRLREEGGSFSAVVATARVVSATFLLADTRMPLSAVGFLAGYADGPHFSREFARRTGTSPGRYRTAINHTETDHDLPL